MQFNDYYKASNINECTSVGISIEDKVILAKNRDRTYYPRVKIVRDLINGLEVAYMYDEDTDYSEGMNEAHIGIVNTTLQGKKDENEGSSKNKGKRLRRLSGDGHKIRTALGYTDPEKVVKSLDLFDRGLGGHTTVAYENGFISIEKLKFGKPVIKQYDKNGVIVRANHGIAYPDQGYQFGKDRESTLSRVYWATKEARLAISPEDLLNKMRQHHEGIHGYLEPYRTNYKVWTSSQILLNVTDLQMIFVVDENADFIGIEDRLPKGHTPKIDIQIQKLETKFVTRDADYKGDERENPEDTAKFSL
ncbi:MAG: hypothetical protein EBU90_00985 [Proteobacteria bacterium]|nr:hypothetical protein [Pseudomonadota bacterium]NBP13008.1 hypothetical protein [bacterium]